MPFNVTCTAIFILWFFCGALALKFLEEKVDFPENKMRLRGCIRLLSLLLGPVVLAGAAYYVYLWERLLNIFSKEKRMQKKEQDLQLLDAKGYPLVASDENETVHVAYVRHIILEALNYQTSDIFIDPQGDEYHVRMRIDGTIKQTDTISKESAGSVIGIIKVLAGMDIAERRRPQDGSFSAIHGNQKPSFRVATAGVFGGEKITIRILAADMGTRRLDSMGFQPTQYKQVLNALNLPSGMILMCGPTGSGKTSTLYAMLTSIDYNLRNVISIEDPVEHVMPNISQMEVNVRAGITFASLLRNSLRQNPDIICVGEIRDEETAQIAAHAAQTGHLIIATLHSNDNIGTIDRLTNLGIPLRSLAHSLHVIISQRLIRMLCPECRVKANLSDSQKDLLRNKGLDPENVYAAGPGCPKCNGTGYHGRQALFDILIIDAGLRAILESPDATVTSISQYISEHQTVADISNQALALVGQGKTSFEEYEHTTTNV